MHSEKSQCNQDGELLYHQNYFKRMIRRRENGNIIIQRERYQMGGINSDSYGAFREGKRSLVSIR